MIIMTTDHGRSEKDGKGHGGQSFRQRSTWMVSNKKFNNYAGYSYPGIVDIMPTFANYLSINIPTQVKNEIDGVPLIGKISLAHPKVNIFQNKLDISWQNFNEEGTVKVWICTTNNFSKFGTDQYILLNEVPVKQKNTVIDITKYESSFYKILLEGKYNSVNKWFIKGD